MNKKNNLTTASFLLSQNYSTSKKIIKNKFFKLLKRSNQHIQKGRFGLFSKKEKLNIYKRLKRYAQRLDYHLRWTTAGFVFVLANSYSSYGQTFQKVEDVNSPFIFYNNPLKNVKLEGQSIATFGDIDNDGDLDVFIGEELPGGNATIYFSENIGDATTPVFGDTISSPFGLSTDDILANPYLLDIDDDGDLDMFVGERNGQLNFFENQGTNQTPSFSTPSPNPFGLNLPSDVSSVNAAFVDIDDDGDYDLFINSYYSQLYFFENQGSSNSPSFGNPISNPFGLNDFGYYYDSDVTFHDIDEDGDLDFFAGYASSIIYYENVGNSSLADFSSSPMFNPFNIQNQSWGDAPNFVDLDNDGTDDYISGNSAGEFSFQKNDGNSSPPVFKPSQANVSDSSAPTLADIDNDGDLDLFAGNYYRQIHFFENKGTASIPSFDPVPISNPFGINIPSGLSTIPTLVDIDGDDDYDIIAGLSNGEIRFIENTGDAENPSFELNPSSSPFGLVEVQSMAAPSFIDIDNDGDKDAFVGELEGNVVFYENEGTANNPIFNTHILNPFGFSSVGIASSFSFYDIDDDGDFDAFVGEANGDFNFFENIGDVNNPSFNLSLNNNSFGLTSLSAKSIISFSDIDNDGDQDAICGEDSGLISYFENTTAVPAGISDFSNLFDIQVFPNPVNDLLQISFNEIKNGRIQIINGQGQVLRAVAFSKKENLAINILDLPQGHYHLKLEDFEQGAFSTKTIFVLKK